MFIFILDLLLLLDFLLKMRVAEEIRSLIVRLSKKGKLVKKSCATVQLIIKKNQNTRKVVYKTSEKLNDCIIELFYEQSSGILKYVLQNMLECYKMIII